MILLFFWITDEDEDGDRITVRSNDELQAMFAFVSTN